MIIGYSAILVIINQEIESLTKELDLEYDLYEALMESGMYDNLFAVFDKKGTAGIREALTAITKDSVLV